MQINDDRKPCSKEIPKYVERIVEKPVVKTVYIDTPPKECPKAVHQTFVPCFSKSDYVALHPEAKEHFPYDYFKYINFRDSSWKTAVQLRKHFTWKNYTNTIPSSFKYPPAEQHTKANMYKDPVGLNIILFSHVCYNIRSYEMNLYVSSERAGKQILNRINEKFKNGFKFSISVSSFPYYDETNSKHQSYDYDDNVIISNNNWMIIPHSQRNIAHFTEAINYILHTAHEPNKYPPIENLYLPRYNSKNVFPWINMYFDIIKETYPPEHQFRIYDENTIKETTDSLICFKHLGISSRIFHRSYGGTFVSFTEVDTIRAMTYKRFDLNPSKTVLYLPTVSLLERANIGGNLQGRHIENLPEVESYFQTEKLSYRYQQVILEKLTPEDQVKTMLDTDVLLGALGSGFVNCIFMLPGSCAIIASPPYIGGFFFHTIAELAQIYYLPMYNYTSAIPSECDSYIDEFGAIVGEYSQQKEDCKSLLYKSNVYIVPGVLDQYLHLATIHLTLVKYADPSFL